MTYMYRTGPINFVIRFSVGCVRCRGGGFLLKVAFPTVFGSRSMTILISGGIYGQVMNVCILSGCVHVAIYLTGRRTNKLGVGSRAETNILKA